MLWLHLNTASRTALLKACAPHFTTTFVDHVTLLFDVPLNQEMEKMIGQECMVFAYEHCWNDSIQAVRVKTDSLPNQYGVPHITISAADGIEPFFSVEMLRDDRYHSELLNNIPLTGSIRFVL